MRVDGCGGDGCKLEADKAVVCRVDPRVCRGCRDSAPAASPRFDTRNTRDYRIALRKAEASGLTPAMEAKKR